MSQKFDPYDVWLGIPKAEQPPDYYRLLGLSRFEDSPQVIATAAARQTAYLKMQSDGPHGELSREMLLAVAASLKCLLDSDQKAQYDLSLCADLMARKAALGRKIPTAAASVGDDDEEILPTAKIAGPSRKSTANAPRLVKPVKLMGLDPLEAAGGTAGVCLKSARPTAVPWWQHPALLAGIGGGALLLVLVLILSSLFRGDDDAAEAAVDPTDSATTTEPAIEPTAMPAPPAVDHFTNPPPPSSTVASPPVPPAIEAAPAANSIIEEAVPPVGTLAPPPPVSTTAPSSLTPGQITSSAAGVPFDAVGSSVYAVRFSGKQYLSITDSRSLGALGAPFTAEVWIRPFPGYCGSPVLGNVVGKGDGARGWRIGFARMEHDQRILMTKIDLDEMSRSFGKMLASEGHWQHVAVCRSEETVSFFLNGRLITAPISCDDHAATSPGTLYLFGDPRPVESNFRGDTRAFRLSSSVRYTSEFDPPLDFTADDNTLVLLDFNKGEGAILPDLSGNGHDGKIMGGLAEWVMYKDSSAIVPPPANVPPAN